MSTASYRFDFEQIKRSVRMDQVIGFLGLPALKQSNPRQWKGACPFCKNHDCFVITNDGVQFGSAVELAFVWRLVSRSPCSLQFGSVHWSR